MDPNVAAMLARPAVTPGAAGDRPIRILFVFAWLVVGGEETEVRLLAEHLPRDRYVIDVVACFRKDGMPEQTHEQLARAGVRVDTTPYHLSFPDTVTYLAGLLPAYDIAVGCQDVADLYPALDRLHLRPALIEHGGLVSEALSGPKHHTARYVGVCDTIRDAAASRMPDRPEHALAIPSMVDLGPFDRADRAAKRAELGIGSNRLVAGWLGRLDAKKRVEDFIEAAALVAPAHPKLDFLVIGGPDAFMPDYADRLYRLAEERGLSGRLRFLGDRADVPELLTALDMFVWLSRGEGMPHVIAEAGAARLPVIATPDNGALEQISDDVSGLFVPHEAPAAVAAAMTRLVRDAGLRARLGQGLRTKVEAEYAVAAVIPQWRALFDHVRPERQVTPIGAGLLPGFWLGGFECSSHNRQWDGQRRDMIALSDHDRRAAQDYRLLRSLGLAAARDGVRWHLIEVAPGVYDWSSCDAQLAAARETGLPIIWDLMHYGWPDDIDIWSAEFTRRFAAFARAAVARIVAATPPPHMVCPVNEISFMAWGGGDVGYLNPFAHGRGFELKAQLARCAIAAMEAIRADHPGVRFIHAEPTINVVTDPHRPWEAQQSMGHHQAQYQAWEMIAGRYWPQLGGREDLLDVLGVNYYPNNQWIHGGPPLDYRDPRARPLRDLLAEVFARYGRPIFIAETGIEGDRRAEWIGYIVEEALAARALGVPLEGICFYPVVGHVGWDDDRYCPNGLIEAPAPTLQRSVLPEVRAALQFAQAKVTRGVATQMDGRGAA